MAQTSESGISWEYTSRTLQSSASLSALARISLCVIAVLRLAGEEIGWHGLARVGVVGVGFVLVAAVLQAAAIRAERVCDAVDRTKVGAVTDFDVARSVAAGLADVGGLVRGHWREVLRLAGECAAKDGDEFGEGEFGVFHSRSGLGDVLKNEIKRFGPSVELWGDLKPRHFGRLRIGEEAGQFGDAAVLDLETVEHQTGG